MNKKILFSCLMLTLTIQGADQSRSYWDSIKDWLFVRIPTTSYDIAKSVVTKPTTMAAIAGATYGTYALGNAVDSQVGAVAGVGLAFGLVNLSTFLHWLDLRSRYIELSQKQTGSNDPYVRNVYYNPFATQDREFKDGYHMMSVYSTLSDTQKNVLKQSFLRQINVANDVDGIHKIDKALVRLAKDIAWYDTYTNIQYLFASACDLATPEALLTGDVLINHSLEDEFKELYDQATEFGLYSLRLDWKKRLHLALPKIYSWNYGMASSCVWLLLHHYSKLKAMRTIIESVAVSDKEQKYAVHLKYDADRE